MASLSATSRQTSGSTPMPMCVEDTSTCSAYGETRSMHASQATMPSRRVYTTVSGTRIGDAASSRAATTLAALPASGP